MQKRKVNKAAGLRVKTRMKKVVPYAIFSLQNEQNE